MQKPRAIVGRASDTSALPAERNNSEKQPRLDARTRRSRVDGSPHGAVDPRAR